MSDELRALLAEIDDMTERDGGAVNREPRTDAGKRLLWFFETREMPSGRRVPASFDARLAERIVQEFVWRIEAEAAALPNDQKDPLR